MSELLIRLAPYPVMEAAFALAVALVLIDYLFPVDFAAYLGYLCFGAGVFFAAPWGLASSLLLGIAVVATLVTLHHLWFSRFLTNAGGRVDPGLR